VCNVARTSYVIKRIKTFLRDRKGKKGKKEKKKRANYWKYE
jgi:hypothetical protein